MSTAKKGIDGGLTTLLVGPPGTAKSTTLGSIAEVPGIKKALLLAPTPREVNSFKYTQYRDVIDHRVYQDFGWHPTIDRYEAGAFTSLYKDVVALYEDETYDAVLVDTYDGAVSLAAHELLAPERSPTPRDLRDSRGYYGALKYKLSDFTTALINLASPALSKPKHVFVAVHAQPTREDDKQKTTDSVAKGIEFLGEVQPMVEGGHRHGIAGEFDVVAFTMIKHEMVRDGNKMRREARFVMQVDADPERHAKAAVIPRLNREIPASLPALFEAIAEASER